MSYYSGPTVPLNVMINKEKTKVLFAEANIEFKNVLLSFLALPLAKADKIISLGSLSTLHRGLSNMDESYFSVRAGKELLLNPRTSFRAEISKLVVDITDSPPNNFYVCSDEKCPKIGHKNVSVYSGIAKCDCGRWLNREIHVVESLEGGSFVTNPSSFIITDELRVVPILSGLFETLDNLGITNTQGAELLSLKFDITEIRKLFAICLTSATPLTDMIIKKTGMPKSIDATANLGISLHHLPKELAHSREMVLKAFVQKSMNKFLYAEATDEFVELLLSFLTVPVGGAEFLFGGNTGFRGIDNLHRSVCNDIDDKRFTTPMTKTRLIMPELPYLYFSEHYFLPLYVEASPDLHYETSWDDPVIKNTSFHEKIGSLLDEFKPHEELFISVKKRTKCIVTDDLTINPCLATSIVILNNLGIPLSDVKEMKLRIGVEEALRILKASLTSKTPLTDALIQPTLTKRLKLTM